MKIGSFFLSLCFFWGVGGGRICRPYGSNKVILPVLECSTSNYDIYIYIFMLHIFIKDYSLFEQVFVGYLMNFQEFDHDISCVW